MPRPVIDLSKARIAVRSIPAMNDMKLRSAAVTAPLERSVSSVEHELWAALRHEIAATAAREEALRCFLEITVLRHHGFASALPPILARPPPPHPLSPS